MQRLFMAKRTKAAAIVIAFVLPPLMLGFAYFHAHRPAVHVAGERTVWDYIVMNSDILLGLIFLAACAIPFFLVFEKKKAAGARACTHCGHGRARCGGQDAVLPHSAAELQASLSHRDHHRRGLRPETGFLTGALTGFLSNFIFGRGAMDAVADVLLGHDRVLWPDCSKTGVSSRRDRDRTYFTGSFWTRLCPNGTEPR